MTIPFQSYGQCPHCGYCPMCGMMSQPVRITWTITSDTYTQPFLFETEDDDDDIQDAIILMELEFDEDFTELN